MKNVVKNKEMFVVLLNILKERNERSFVLRNVSFPVRKYSDRNSENYNNV